jgi:hypothetical protein
VNGERTRSVCIGLLLLSHFLFLELEENEGIGSKRTFPEFGKMAVFPYDVVELLVNNGPLQLLCDEDPTTNFPR